MTGVKGSSPPAFSSSADEIRSAVGTLAFFVNNHMTTLDGAIRDLLKAVAGEVAISGHWDSIEREEFFARINKIASSL